MEPLDGVKGYAVRRPEAGDTTDCIDWLRPSSKNFNLWKVSVHPPLSGGGPPCHKVDVYHPQLRRSRPDVNEVHFGNIYFGDFSEL